jgi:hypothetical protein
MVTRTEVTPLPGTELNLQYVIPTEPLVVEFEIVKDNGQISVHKAGNEKPFPEMEFGIPFPIDVTWLAGGPESIELGEFKVRKWNGSEDLVLRDENGQNIDPPIIVLRNAPGLEGRFALWRKEEVLAGLPPGDFSAIRQWNYDKAKEPDASPMLIELQLVVKDQIGTPILEEPDPWVPKPPQG